MFNWLFKKKTDREVLELKYKRLMVASYELAKTDSEASELKIVEAEKVSKLIDEIDAQVSL